MQTQINLRTLKAVALAASNEETRYYLNGVFIECRETRVTYVATNGLILLCAQEELPPLEVNDPPRLVGNWIMPCEIIKAIKLSNKGNGAFNIGKLSRDGETGLRLEVLFGSTQVFKPIDGAFPDWRRVLPAKAEGIGAYDKEAKTWNGEPALFHPAKLATMGAFAIAMGFTYYDNASGRKAPAMHLHYGDNRDPHAVTFWGEGGDRAFGVIMPRGRGTVPAWNGAPDWTREIYPNVQEEIKQAAE